MTRIVFLSAPAGFGTRGAPYGAACVASALKAAMPGTVHCTILEANKGETCDAFSHRAMAEQADIVGLSVYLWNRRLMLETAEKIKLLYPNLLVIAGGPEASANPQALVQSGWVDMVIRGEAEESVCELVTEFQRQNSSMLGSKRIVEAQLPNLEKLPSPWLDGTLQPDAYASAPLELARGCPYRCSFCFESRGRSDIRRFPPQRAEAELAVLSAAKVEELMVLDPTFNASELTMAQFCTYYGKLKFRPRCVLELRAELITQRQARLLSGVEGFLQLGLQSSNPRALKAVNRSFNPARYTAGIRHLEEYGLTYGLDLMYGLPEDNLESFKASIDYAIGLGPNHLDIFRLSVLPGTKLMERAQELGLVYQSDPPYHVLQTPSFSASTLEIAEQLANAADQLYNRGRAVMWFRSLCKLARAQPSAVLQSWQKLAGSISANDKHEVIEHTQVLLARFLLAKKAAPLLEAAVQVIQTSGAWTRALAENQSCVLELDYHPEDILNTGCADISLLAQSCKRHRASWNCSPGPQGPRFSLLRKHPVNQVLR